MASVEPAVATGLPGMQLKTEPAAQISVGAVLFRARAQHVWDATAGAKASDLQFAAGDVIAVHSTAVPGQRWWTGTSISTGNRGIFPSNYVSLIPDGPQATPIPSGRAAGGGTKRRRPLDEGQPAGAAAAPFLNSTAPVAAVDETACQLALSNAQLRFLLLQARHAVWTSSGGTTRAHSDGVAVRVARAGLGGGARRARAADAVPSRLHSPLLPRAVVESG